MKAALGIALVAACAAAHGAGSAKDVLTWVADVPLSGGATRLDYAEIDAARRLLVIAHMNDASVLVLDANTGATRKLLTGIPEPRGVAIADDVGKIFVTSTPGHVVVIDSGTLAEVARVATGATPDGDAWDPDDKVLGVSEQHDGALSLLANSGMGARTIVKVGSETGNVAYDATRKRFWITAVQPSPPDQLVAVDPATATVTARIALPGCAGAHGLRLHPDARSAFVACEDNHQLARVDLDGAHAIAIAATGRDPDVLSIDPGIGWLYVAAESGDVTIWDVRKPGVSLVGHAHPGDHAHTVAADPKTHRVFFPLPKGNGSTPVLRIMRPR